MMAAATGRLHRALRFFGDHRTSPLGKLFRLDQARMWWVFRPTLTGKYLIVGLVVCGSFGMHSVEVPVFRVFCAVAAVMTVAFVAGWVFRARVAITGEAPEQATAGQPFAVDFTLTNESQHRTARDIAVGYFGLPPGLRADGESDTIAELGPGETVSLPVRLLPLRRGHYLLPDLRSYTTFPFGLWRTGAGRRRGGRLVVLPAFHRLHGIDVPVGTRYQPGGIALTSHVGESPEYIGNREYRPGDSWRRLDARAWARLGTPIVREYQEEYYHRVALVLDTFVPGLRRAPATGFPQLEAAVSLSAAVADVMSRGEYVLDLFAAGPELYVFRSGRHIAHFENVLDILACVEACRQNPFDTVTPALAEELGHTSTVICVLLDWDESRRELVRAAVESGCRVKVLIARDEPTSDPIWETDTEDVRVYPLKAIREGGLEVV